MRRDYDGDRYDENDDEGKERKRSTSFPVVVVIAGVVWIGFGLLVMVGTIGRVAQNRGENIQAAPTIGIGLLGFVYFLTGIKVIRGQMEDLTWAAIGSFVFGVIYCGIGAWLVAAIERAPKGDQDVGTLIGCAFAVGGVLLLVAGTFALMGKAQYVYWRKLEGLTATPRKSKGRRHYSDDDNDDEDHENDARRRGPSSRE
jgi:hypothetical protein